MNVPSTGFGGLKIFRWLLFAAVFVGIVQGVTSAGTISTSEKDSWSENAGWINFRPQYGGVTVYSDYLSGYAWHENLGWLKPALMQGAFISTALPTTGG
jgi:hypothetical protein